MVPNVNNVLVVPILSFFPLITWLLRFGPAAVQIFVFFG